MSGASDCVSASKHTHTQTCRKLEKYEHDIGAIASALQEEGDCKAWGGRVEALRGLEEEDGECPPDPEVPCRPAQEAAKECHFPIAFGFRLLGQRRATDLSARESQQGVLTILGGIVHKVCLHFLVKIANLLQTGQFCRKI